MNLAISIFFVATGLLAALMSLGWWGMLIFGNAGMPAAVLASAGTVYSLFAIPFAIGLRSTRHARRDAAELSGKARPTRTDELGLRLRTGGKIRFLTPLYLLITSFWWLAAAVGWACYDGARPSYRVAFFPTVCAGVMSLGPLAEVARRVWRRLQFPAKS